MSTGLGAGVERGVKVRVEVVNAKCASERAVKRPVQ